MAHRRFKELPSQLKSATVKERSKLSALSGKLVIHQKDLDFFDEHVQDTPTNGSKSSLHRVQPTMDLNMQFSRKLLIATSTSNSAKVFGGLKKELAEKIDHYMEAYTQNAIKTYKDLVTVNEYKKSCVVHITKFSEGPTYTSSTETNDIIKKVDNWWPVHSCSRSMQVQ